MANCMICGTIATDPDRGPSLWVRAVVDDEQVLVCPECREASPDWEARAERCSECGSSRLSKTLGDKVCRACGHQSSDEQFKLN